MPAAVLLPWSWMLCGPSQAQVVTQLSSALSPLVVWKGGQGEASSRSVAQKANFGGRALGGAVAATGRRAGDVELDQADGASDGRVGGEGGSEAARAAVDAGEFARRVRKRG